MLELFGQQIGFHGPQVHLQEVSELATLLRGQVGALLQKTPARFGQNRFLSLLPETACLLAPHLVQSPMLQAILDHPLNRAIDALSRGAEAFSDTLPGKILSPASQVGQAHQGLVLLAVGPRNLLDGDSTVWT